MKNHNIITRISNELGNQMFMYASTLGISKKINRTLLLDNESAYLSNKNISKYGLNNFTVTSEIAPNNLKFLGSVGYLKRKFIKKIDRFLIKKSFHIEKKDNNKISTFDDEIFYKKFADNAFFEGYFETEKYFSNIKDLISKEFNFIDKVKYIKSPYFHDLNMSNSVSICLRQNRFSEGKGDIISMGNSQKSTIFTKEQIIYINESINFFKNKINNPKFFLWSNDFKNIESDQFNEKITLIKHDEKFFSEIDKRCLDLFLISVCKNHIVIPSSFNWWGAWLSQNLDKTILRPSNNFFSLFKVNNKDLWPSDWIEID